MASFSIPKTLIDLPPAATAEVSTSDDDDNDVDGAASSRKKQKPLSSFTSLAKSWHLPLPVSPSSFFLLLPFALTANEGIFAFNECGLESGRSCYDKPGALRLKLITIFTILIAGLVGVCLPLVSHSFPICRVDSNPFVLVKAFALVAYPHQQDHQQGHSRHPPPPPQWRTSRC